MEFGREFITLFDRVQIRYYGLIIVAAMLVAAWIAARLAKRNKLDPDHIWGALTWAIIPAIIGARLWFILFPPQSLVDQGQTTAWYFQNFFNLENGAIAIWSGGLHIFGALLGGGLGAYLYLRRNKLNIPVWLDIAAVALPLGQSIGRWANYVNQELYGIPTTLPWGITIEGAKRVGEYRSLVDFPATTTLFHPLFLYEFLWNLLAFVVLLNLFLRNRNSFKPGDFFLMYVMQYTFIRFLLEFIRVEQILIAPGFPINFTQLVCALGFAAALFVFARRRSVPNTAPVVTTTKKAA
ncbi:MAG: prolipoprotein diacylglyceryl transferase [Chloroflexota bacterium]|nr:prolipoprotein diacylglyceryl transferase [Chloroflexota bacterium]